MAMAEDQSLPVFRVDSVDQQSFTNCLMMEKRQLFLRSYQFSRKRTLSERIKGCLVRTKRIIWARLMCARKLRKLMGSRFGHRSGYRQRRYSMLFPILSSSSSEY